MLTVFLVETIIIVIGYQNTMNLKVTELDLRINKDAGRLESLNIVMISDIHINALTTKKKLRNIIKLINEQSPDIVLFVGDIVDTQIDPFNKQNLGTLFLAINSKYGIFAVTGNHEYIGDHIKTINSLSKYGVTFLRDDVIKIENSFYLVGREDLSAYRSLKKKRKSLKDLIVNNNKKYPILLMDHQPIDLDIASDNGIDLQMSGHTHNGQLFPFNLITDLLFELPWGYLKKGETHYYVSCGVGTAGIPLRTGSYPEIVNIKLIFNENKNSNKYISSSK
ncbi:MAG: metallophosphoesterase [Spirochaetota bacterium]|nr:metallophosphoesterase [Spirochaetota bacterium]